MEWIHAFFTKISVEPVQFVYGAIAVCGGLARYLNGVAIDGTKFNGGILLASAFVSGFSGWMFATMGVSLNMPQEIIFMMAGTGGFFGDQTMKFIMEYLQKKSIQK